MTTVLLLLLPACAPAAQRSGAPELAVVGAPTEARVMGLADELQDLLQARYGPLPYDFIPRRVTGFQETHRDMFGQRAPLQAAFIARALGARLTLMVGAPLYERETEIMRGASGEKRKVEVAVQLRVEVVEPQDAQVVAGWESRVYRAARIEPAAVPLAPLAEDPDLRRARHRALEELAGPLALRLWELLASTCSSREGSAGTPPVCAPR